MSSKRKKPVEQPISLVTEFCATKEQLDNAKLIQSLEPRLALDSFRTNTAKSTDWLMLQYWLYYAEALVSMFNTEVDEHRLQLGVIVGESIQALYAAGRRYNESKFTIMSATEEEVALITEGISIMEQYKNITDEKTLLIIAKHVQKVLKVK